MRVRKLLVTMLATVLAIAGSLVAAQPAQAHPIYKRAFGNQYYGQCMWANQRAATLYNYIQSCGISPNTAAKWKLHVVQDSYVMPGGGSTGHEVWVLESVQYPNTCLTADGAFSRTRMGTCNWTAYNNYNVFEAFYMGPSTSGGIYQLKSITWFEHGYDYCLNVDGEKFVTYGACNSLPRSYWTVSAAA